MVHEPQERLAADENRIDGLLAFRVGPEAHLHHFGEADDGVERRSDIVAYGREEVAPGLAGALLRLDLLLEKPLLASAEDVEEVEDDGKRREEEHELDDHLQEHVVAYVLHDALDHAGVDRLADECAERGLRRIAYREAYPHERRKEDHGEDADPDHDGASEAGEPVDEEHVPVLEESAEAPDGQHEVRLGCKGFARDVVRHEHEEAEADRHHDAGDSGDPFREREASGVVLRDGENGGGRVSVGDCRAEVRDVHRPSGHGAPEERNRERRAHHEDDCVGWRAVAVEPPETCWNHPAFRHRVHEAARGDQRAEYARQLSGEHRAADYGDAHRAECLLRRGEDRHGVDSLEFRKCVDVVAPRRVAVRQRNDGQKGE